MESVTIVKATAEEKAKYIQTPPLKCYPLFGYVNCNGTVLIIEDCRMDMEGPKYEIMAPDGMLFGGETHTLLCDSYYDIKEMVLSYELTPCNLPYCNCGLPNT